MAQRRLLSPVLVFLLLAAGGGVLGAGIGRLLRQGGGVLPRPEPGPLLAGLLVWVVAGIALHELGHLAGGLRAGFRFILYTVGPLRVAREARGIRVGLNRAINLAGGVVLMVPRTPAARPDGLASFIAGGPLASLAAALALGLLARAAPSSSAWFPFLVVGAAINAGLGVATLIPAHFGGFDSDGRQLLDLLRGGRLAEQRLLVRAVLTASLLGTRPREWDPAVLARLLELSAGESGQAVLVAHLLHYSHLIDRGELEPAGAALAAAGASQPDAHPMLRAPMRLEEAWLALQRGDVAAAQAHHAGALKHARFLEPHSRARVEAALLHAEGRTAEAIARAREGLAHLGRAMDAGGAALERDWLEQLARSP